jgi:hypothetical protein
LAKCLPARGVSAREKKKSPDVAVRAWKFWERMPERPDPFAATAHISQVRKEHAMLREMQLGPPPTI